MKVMAFTSPGERFIFGLAAAVIAIPLLYGLPKIGIFVGPQSPEEMLDEDPPEPETQQLNESADKDAKQ